MMPSYKLGHDEPQLFIDAKPFNTVGLQAWKRRATVAADLPQYCITDIEDHNNMETGVWVTYGSDVFDITQFVESHPGGDKILLAAGNRIEPFWELYTLHKNAGIYKILASMKIGQIVKSQRKLFDNFKGIDHYKDEPIRPPLFRINSLKPFDGEPLPGNLMKKYLTPTEHFYIRNHLPVPLIEETDYRLQVQIGDKSEPISLSIEDLKSKFKEKTVMVTLQCAGNRRHEMGEHKPIFGQSSGITAISNATWTGVSLREVLIYAGYIEEDESIDHVHFEGLDKDIAGEAYAVSIPIDKAASVQGDVLLAYDMNGKPLSRDHGYPLRVVVPGVIGARSVKWLGRIVASGDQHDSFWQQKDYKSSPPSAPSNYDLRDSEPIYESPVQSVICSPQSQDLPIINYDDEGNAYVTVSGYATSGGGNRIMRVDVSADGGDTWTEAELDTAEQRPYRQWAWTLWQTQVPVKSGTPVRLVCKAVDSSHNVQPENISGIWNVRGFLNNSWHRVELEQSTTTSSEQDESGEGGVQGRHRT